MRRFILIIFGYCFLPYANAQFPPCTDYKFDTIEIDILIEADAKFIYYVHFDAIIQDNVGFPLSCSQNGADLYQCDTVILLHPYYGKFSAKLKPCTDMSAITKLYSFLDGPNPENQDKIKNNMRKINGINYVGISGKFVVVNSGTQEIIVPDPNSNTSFKYKRKKFNSTLQIVNVLNYCLTEKD